MKEFTINDYVKVKLNDKGYKILEEFYDTLLQKSNEKGTLLPENFYDGCKKPETDEEGYAEFTIWFLIQVFGQYIKPGSKTPFEPVFLIKEDDLIDHKVKKKKRKALRLENIKEEQDN